jgi:hypothetical protein
LSIKKADFLKERNLFEWVVRTPEEYSFLRNKIVVIGAAIVIGPNVKKFVGTVIGDEISKTVG